MRRYQSLHHRCLLTVWKFVRRRSRDAISLPQETLLSGSRLDLLPRSFQQQFSALILLTRIFWSWSFEQQFSELDPLNNNFQVAKEAAAAAVLLPSLRQSHCAACLKHLPPHPSLFPCLNCPAVFCGRECKKQGCHPFLCRMEHTMDEVLEQVFL